jgi:hypothetical protein
MHHRGSKVLSSQAFFTNTLIKLIVEDIERIKENLTYLGATPDFPTYTHQVGKIDGLRKALELIDQAESELNGVERG